MFYLNKDFINANIPRTIRFTDHIFEQLRQASHEHKISFNSLVLQCCYYALSQLSSDQDYVK